MEEEMMNQPMPEQEALPERQGMMGAGIADTPGTGAVEEGIERVRQNFENLSDQEKQLAIQLNVPQFRDFMSKVFGQGFGSVMQEAIPEPQMAQPQPEQQVSPQSERPSPMTGEGMMTQPPVTA
jgi:hypothetical protein